MPRHRRLLYPFPPVALNDTLSHACQPPNGDSPMPYTMASTTCVFGIASHISAQKPRSRVSAFFRYAGPSPEDKLGGAMVAAAAQLGRCHQAEVMAALSEDMPTHERRNVLRLALLGVS